MSSLNSVEEQPDGTVIEHVSFGRLDGVAPIDGIPFANYGMYARGLFSLKTEEEAYFRYVEDEEGFVDGTNMAGYVAIFCDCPVPLTLHDEDDDEEPLEIEHTNKCLQRRMKEYYG